MLKQLGVNFPSKQRIVDGYNAYMRNSKSKKVEILYYIVENKLYKYNSN